MKTFVAFSLSCLLLFGSAGSTLALDADAAFRMRDFATLQALKVEELSSLEKSLVANSLWLGGKWAQADALLAQAEGDMPPSVRPFSDLYRLLAAERTGAREEAIKRAKKLVAEGHPLAGFYAALALARLDENKAGAFREALALAGEDASRAQRALEGLADLDALTTDEALRLCALDGHNQKALAKLQSAPPSDERNYRLGWKLYTEGKDDQALPLLKSVAFDSALGQDAAYYAAASLVRAKRNDEALALLKKVLSPASPKYITGPMNRLATLMARGGEAGRGAEELLWSLAKGEDAKAKTALYTLAKSSSSRAAQARDRLIAAFPHDKRSSDLLWRDGFGAYLAGDGTKALELWGQAKTDDPDMAAQLLYWQAKVFEARGDGQKADALRAQAAHSYPLTYYGLVCGGLQTLSEASLELAPETELEQWGFYTHAQMTLAGEKDLPSALRAAQLCAWLGTEGDGYSLLRPYSSRLTAAGAQWAVLPLLWPRPFAQDVTGAATRFGTSAELIWAVMRQESAFNPNATSWVGAGGLMQLMPATAKDEEKRIGEGALNRYNAQDNIKLGASHLAWLAKRFTTLREIAAAYNGGSGNVNKWNKAFGQAPADEWIERIPFDETREYVKRVSANYMIYQALKTRKER